MNSGRAAFLGVRPRLVCGLSEAETSSPLVERVDVGPPTIFNADIASFRFPDDVGGRKRRVHDQSDEGDARGLPRVTTNDKQGGQEPLPQVIYQRPHSGKKWAKAMRKSTSDLRAHLDHSRTSRQEAVCCFPAVEAFLSATNLQCERIRVKASFRHINFEQRSIDRLDISGCCGMQDFLTADSKACGSGGLANTPNSVALDDEAVGEGYADSTAALIQFVPNIDAPTSKPIMPTQQENDMGSGFCQARNLMWDRYLELNSFGPETQLVQCFLWRCADEYVFTCVPYPRIAKVSRLALALGKPESQIQLCRLKDVQTRTNLPLFVCLPFGIPIEKDKHAPLVVADRHLLLLPEGTDLLFDCGLVALRMGPWEFNRAVRPRCADLCIG